MVQIVENLKVFVVKINLTKPVAKTNPMEFEIAKVNLMENVVAVATMVQEMMNNNNNVKINNKIIKLFENYIFKIFIIYLYNG